VASTSSFVITGRGSVSVGLRGLPMRARSMRPGGGLLMSMRTRRLRIDVIPDCSVFRASFPCCDKAADAAAAGVHKKEDRIVQFGDHLIADFIVAPGMLPFQNKSWEDAGDIGEIEASFRENRIAFDGVEFDPRRNGGKPGGMGGGGAMRAFYARVG
jgi:hypothetical protein